jgi:hypothetical protein
MHVGNDDEDKDTCEDKELEFTPQMMQIKDKSSQGSPLTLNDGISHSKFLASNILTP